MHGLSSSQGLPTLSWIGSTAQSPVFWTHTALRQAVSSTVLHTISVLGSTLHLKGSAFLSHHKVPLQALPSPFLASQSTAAMSDRPHSH